MTACMVAFDADELRRKVHDTYERVARAPASSSPADRFVEIRSVIDPTMAPA
jgi:hypothetical protein